MTAEAVANVVRANVLQIVITRNSPMLVSFLFCCSVGLKTMDRYRTKNPEWSNFGAPLVPHGFAIASDDPLHRSNFALGRLATPPEGPPETASNP
jgi:hypothetical protein